MESELIPQTRIRALIGEIVDSATPEELDRFEQAEQERKQPDYSLPQ